jgi:ABC-type multidrug transport system fused ATPase/permease subunit
MANTRNQKNNKKEKHKINFKYNLSEYFSFLMNYKTLLFLTLFMVLILESRHVLENYLFKVIIDNGTSFSTGTLAKPEFLHVLIIVAVSFLALYVLVGGVARWLFLHFLNLLEGRLIFDVKKKYFDHIVTLDHGFHVSHKTGSLISRLTRGRSAMERMTDVITFSLAPLIFQLTILIFALLYLDKLSAIIIMCTVAVFIIYGLIIQRLQQKANIEENEAEDIEKANVADIFTNIDSIKYFGKENFIKKRFDTLASKTKFWMIKHWNYFRWFDSGQTIILGLGTFFLIYFPMKAFLGGTMSLGTITFIYTAYGSLFGPLFSFMHGMRDIYRAMADFEDLFEYGKIQKEIKDSSNAKSLEIKEGKVEFKNITFNYGKRTIFKNFSLHIPQNKKVALVGHSGSGKTTLIKLLYRLYDVQEGNILIDEKDIRDFKQESLRSEMAIVPQECILFDATVYENILFSRPDATRAEVMKAIKFAQLDRIIEKFPNKERTIVGERGVKLSGGEKQRVSIARAILADKKILVLDEATSSLDSETEHEIQQDLLELMKGRTSIIIAHRLSTIMHADKIIVLKEGKIVQTGTHNQLIKQPGEYKHLWNLQKGGYIK